MAWDQSTSASFTARHASGDADDAHRVLQSLEHTRDRLEPVFHRRPAEITVVLHSRPVALALAHPPMLGHWAAASPAARRYVTGWAGRSEIHVLSPAALRQRGAGDGATASQEMLRLSAASLYARRVIAENTPELVKVMGLIRTVRELRWAWLIEGAARWYSGQTAHARAAIVRRLREGGRPSFPPSVRDAPLLGGTVLELLADEQGEPAVARIATRLHPQGPKAGLERAFGRRLVHTEGRLALAPVADRLLRALTRASPSVHVHRERQQPDHQRAERERDQQAGQQPGRPDRRLRVRAVLDQAGVEQQLAGGVDPGGGDHHVPRAREQHVRDVEARGAAQHRRHPRLEQQPLQELALALVAHPRDLDQRPLGELRLDLPRPAPAL